MSPEYHKISGFYPSAKFQVLKEAKRSPSFPAGRYTLKRKLMMSPSSTTGEGDVGSNATYRD
jgi:hypothetical protein